MPDRNNTNRVQRRRFPPEPRHSPCQYGWVLAAATSLLSQKSAGAELLAPQSKRFHIVKFRLCKSAEKNCSEAGSYYSGPAYVAEHRTEVRSKGKRAEGPALFRCRLSRFFFCAFALLYDGRDLAVLCTSAGGSAHQRSSLRTMAAPFAARAMAAMPFLAASLER